MKTPVIFIIFNRPKETLQVFETIRAAKPPKLLVIADGPRNEKERERTDTTRAIIESVNWECEVIKYYSDTNVGVKKFLPEGLIWAFKQVDRAIVLEADCLPNADAYRFFEEMLDRYEHDPRIFHIGGNFFQHRNEKFIHSKSNSNSYYFSIIPHIWGWATWSRAWKFYDPKIKVWPEVKASGKLKKVLTNPAVYEYWETVWDQYYAGKIESWDGQWTFACLLHNGLSITPTKNVVSNIGFGPDAIHSTDMNSMFAHLPLEHLDFPLIHPQLESTIIPNKNADNFTWKQNFGINRKFRQRALGPIRRQFPNVYATIVQPIKKILRIDSKKD